MIEEKWEVDENVDFSLNPQPHVVAPKSIKKSIHKEIESVLMKYVPHGEATEFLQSLLSCEICDDDDFVDE